MPDSACGGGSAPWGVGLLLEGGSAPGGCLVMGWGAWSQGGPAPGRGGIPACTEADSRCEQNDRQVQKYYLGHNFVEAGKKFRFPVRFSAV